MSRQLVGMETHLLGILASIRSICFKVHDKKKEKLTYVTTRSLSLLDSILSNYPQSITESISLYLPTQRTPEWTIYGNTPSLLTLAASSSSEPSLQLSALSTLQTLIKTLPLHLWASKQQTSSSKRSTLPHSFSTVSEKIVGMLECTHEALEGCIQTTNSTTQILVAVVKVCQTGLIKY